MEYNIIIGNIISAIGALVDIIVGIKVDEKKKIIYGNLISSSCSAIAYLILGAYEGVITAIVSITRLLVTNYKDKKNKQWYPIMFVYIILYALSFTQGINVKTIIIFICSLIVFIPKWISKNTQIIRAATFISQTIMLYYLFMVKNYSVMPIIIISDIGMLIGFTKWAIRRKRQCL